MFPLILRCMNRLTLPLIGSRLLIYGWAELPLIDL